MSGTTKKNKSEERHLSPLNYLDYKGYLTALYRARKDDTPKYSYSKFAEDLGFSANNFLSHVISGRRPLTLKAAQTIANALHLKGAEKTYFLTLVKFVNARDSIEREAHFRLLLEYKQGSVGEKLHGDQIAFYSCWHNVAISELLRLPDAPQSPEDIANALVPSIRPLDVRQSLDLLSRIGIIYWDTHHEKWRRTAKDPSTGDEVRDFAIAGFHQQMIDLGKASVTSVSSYQREISSVTILLSEEKMQRVKALVRDLERLILEEDSAAGEGLDVYQCNVQLFPLSKLRRRGSYERK